jgi:hypothetical protein
MAPTANKIYKELIRITDPFLGPSSERFINRQIRYHLNKDPEEIVASDVKDLVDWIRLSLSLLTDDGTAIKEYVKNIKAIYKG